MGWWEIERERVRWWVSKRENGKEGKRERERTRGLKGENVARRTTLKRDNRGGRDGRRGWKKDNGGREEGNA